MKLKDLFKSTKTLGTSSLDDIASELESQEYVQSFNKDRLRFMPNVDYSDPKNFAFFGSAEKYYTDAFLRIRGNYPYDGSDKEKYDWLNESTFLDMYIFEHRYPRFNGYANMGYHPTNGWGTQQFGSLISGYGKPDYNVYIKTFGGPNQSSKSGLTKQFDDANKYSTASLDSTASSPSNGAFRESNLNYNLSGGVTLEMWVKKPAFDTAKTEKEVLFDLWNGEASGSAQYGRLRLELTGASSGSPFLLTALSGTGATQKGVQNQSLGTNITKASITDWTHVALSLKNSGSHIQTNLYINGALNQRQTLSNAALNPVTGTLISYIGALQTAPSGNVFHAQLSNFEGAGKFSGSIDEFRFWKTERSSKDIGRYYWTNVGAGTNTDEANTDLGVYYKFNEGITEDASIDANVLDYSGRVSNGVWTGYQAGARNTGSAIVLSKAAKEEFKDPTIYSSHPQYIAVLDELEASGSIHDIDNNASLFNGMPSWILEEDDEKDGNLRNLTQVMASFFDNIYLYIQEVNSLKDVYAHFQTKILETNEYEKLDMTSITGSTKPLPFADRLLTNAGFVAPELFADATVLEALIGRSEDEEYEMKIHDVKNQIYQNVYSVLTSIYKAKGSKKAFRNVLHSFGIDEDVVKINMYADNADYEIGDKHNIRARKEKFVDFNHPDRFNGSIYQYASGSNGVSFISGSESDFEKFIPVTFETQVILPNKIPHNEVHGFATLHSKSVIAGFNRANPADGTDYTIPSPDHCNLQIFSERDESESKRVRFHLSSSALNIHLTSGFYDNQYLNNEWLFAFRIRNDKSPSTDMVFQSSLGSNYVIDFVGYNTEANTTLNSFHLSSSVTAANAHNFLTYSKRIYAGASRQNFTGSLVDPTDHKIGFVRYWMSELSNDVLLNHANDSTNYGTSAPFKSAYLMEDGINDTKVPEIDTLLLHWDFEILSSTDASGQFISLDMTSGSGEQRYVPAFENIKRKFYHGRGDFFLANDEKVIDVEYINTSRITSPEILSGDDMIEIRTQDDLKFTKNTLPQDYFIAFEKSMAQTVSEEMINFLSSITAFNELIGRPVDRYRMEYKDLSKLRQLFFERVTGDLDLDKYIDYYKWLDDALGEMLVALVPASIKHSDGVNNVIENHIFDRDKYTNKFPTIEFQTPDLNGCMKTINRHLYPWKTGHAPVPQEENDNCYWWLERAERTSTGTALVPSDLPANSIHITEEGDVFYKFSSPVSRVSFDLVGLEVAGASQEGTATANWNPVHLPSPGATGGIQRVICGNGFDASLNIPAGSGILFRLTGITRMPTGEFGTDPTNSNRFSSPAGNFSVTYASLENFNPANSVTNNVAGVLNTRQRVFQARNSVLNRSYCTPHRFAVDRVQHLHGGTNYEPNKKRDYIWSATRDGSESPLDYGEFGGFPLRYVLVNNDMFMALKDCNDERPVTEKIKRAFGALDGYGIFHHYFSGSDDGVRKGAMVVPFNIVSSSVDTGYSAVAEGKPGLENDIDIVNLHSDTVDNTNAIPMQSPFTERWVGGHQSRHAPINDGNDNTGSRGEGYRILINKIQNESGSIGIVGPDYPYPHSNIADHNNPPHMYINQAKARFFREERAKRPLNIRNILTSGSQVGNYQKNYQVVHTFGRYLQKPMLNDLAVGTQLHNPTNANLPQTTQEASLVARGAGAGGNVASNFNTSSLYLGDVKSSDAAQADHQGKSIMVNRFSAPGGFETMSEIFLDLYSKEKSSYNALPFRNLQIRGSGSGEANSLIKLIDIHGNRYGLLTHLTRHSSQFGIDSVLGGLSASYHKVNRNSKWDVAEEAYDRDNYWIQHQIPQSDFQYKWVKSSHTASLATSSLQGHILSGFTEPSGTTSRYPIEHIENVVTQSILNIRRNGTPGLLSSTMDQTPYGYPSWEQIRNNDRNINIQAKKSYGFKFESRLDLGNPQPSGSIISTDMTVDESRVTENIPNTVEFKYKESAFKLKYPFVNMKYHFDNRRLVHANAHEFKIQNNETMYESLYRFYSTYHPVSRDKEFEIHTKNVKQILFPTYTKHTKFFVRHRHFFASHYWTDGENGNYQTDINETGSYYRVDEVGRRETEVTATLWQPQNLNTQTVDLIADGHLTNIIPSQSIWSMDSRTYFTGGAPTALASATTGLTTAGWDPEAAASNSAGAPGVLQNQDHHFHNDINHLRLIVSGTAASGSFKLRGATRFGTKSSGSFRVQGVTPTPIAATGTFEVTGANVQGTVGTGQFTAVGAYTPGQNASLQFTTVGATVLGTHASASFQVSGTGNSTTGQFIFNAGKYNAGTKSTGSFTVSDTRQYTAATQATSVFRVSGSNIAEDFADAAFQVKGLQQLATATTSSVTFQGKYTAGTAANANFTAQGLPRFGDRSAFYGVLKDPASTTTSGQVRHNKGVELSGIDFRPNHRAPGSGTFTPESDTSTVKYTKTYHQVRYVRLQNDCTMRRSGASNAGFSGFVADAGIAIMMNLRFGSGGGALPNNSTYREILRLSSGTSSTQYSVQVAIRHYAGSVQLRVRRYFGTSDSDTSNYRQTIFTNPGISVDSANFHKVYLTHTDSHTAGWTLYVDGNVKSGVSLSGGNPSSSTPAKNVNGWIILGGTGYTLRMSSLAIYDDNTGNPSASDHYNNGRFFNHLGSGVASSNLRAYYRFGDSGDPVSDSDSIINDLTSNNNHLNSRSGDEDDIEYFTNTDDFSSTNLKTQQDFTTDFVSTINANLANATAVQHFNRFYVTADSVGVSNDLAAAVEFQTVGDTQPPPQYSSFTSYKITTAYYDSNASNLIKSGDTISIKGTNHIVRHGSAIDAGNMYTFDTGNLATTDADAYKNGGLRNMAFRWKSSSNNRMYMYNTAYTGFVANTNIDMTAVIWIKPNNVTGTNKRTILNFMDDAGDTTPEGYSIQISYTGDDLDVVLFDSVGSGYKNWTFPNCLTSDRYQLVSVAIDRGDITIAPVVTIDETVQSTPTPSGTGTGVNHNIRTILVADNAANDNKYEVEAALASISIWRTKLDLNDIKEIYNKGRWRDLCSHPKFNLCNDWWDFGAGSVNDLPAINDNVATMEGNEVGLNSLSSVPTGQSASPFALEQNDLTFFPSSAGAGDVTLTYGLVYEGVQTYSTGLGTVTIDSRDYSNTTWWNKIDQKVTANNSVGNVSYTNNGTNASFLVTRDAQEADTSAITTTQVLGGATFSSAGSFSGGVDDSGITSTTSAHRDMWINIGTNYDNLPSSIGTDYLRVRFARGGTTEPSTTTAASSFGTSDLQNNNTAYIDVTDFGTDNALWTHIQNVLENGPFGIHSNTGRSGGNFSIVSSQTGRGNANFIVNKTNAGSAGADINITSQTGGDTSSGVNDGQKLEFNYWNNAAAAFQTIRFEVDSQTNASPTVTSGYIAFPALVTTSQGWHTSQGWYGGTSDKVVDNASLWAAMKKIIEEADSGKVGDNYTVAFTTGTANGQPVANFTLTLKSSIIGAANAKDSNVNSGSWDNLTLSPNTGDQAFAPIQNFNQTQIPCGVADGDEIRLNDNGTTKIFQICDTPGEAGESGNTRRIDGFTQTNADFWQDLEDAIQAEMGASDFTVSHTTHNTGTNDPCDDYAEFTVIKNVAGSYDFNTTRSPNPGDSFFNITDTNGTNAFGFGTTVGTGNRLQIGSITVAQAHASDNSGVNVARNQSQANIISNIISSIEGQSPGSSYSVTAHGTGASREFRLTASVAGPGNNRTIVGAGQFSATGSPMAGGANSSGLGVGNAALLKLRVGSDYATTSGISLDDITTPDAVHIRIGTGYTTTSNIGTAGYTTANNIVYINVQDSDLNTDAALYGKIRDAIHNHGDIDMNATLGTGADDNKINLVSTALGAGNAMFYDESSTQVERNPDNGDESGDGGDGASDGHTLTLGSKSIILDDDGSSNAGNNVYVQMVDGNDSSFWANLENAINSNTDFTVASTAALSGGRRTFNLRSDATGSAQNSLTVSTSDASFNVTQTPTAANTGTNETGANDYDETSDEIVIGVYDTDSSGVTHSYKIRCDKDNSHSTSNSDGYSKSTDNSGAIPITTIYVDSTQTNANFWNSIEAALDSCGLSTTQSAGTTPRVFTVVSSVPGARGNAAGTPGNAPGATFNYNSGYLDTRFKNGSNTTGAEDGDTITIHGEIITITHGTQNLSERIVDASGPTSDQFWESLRTCINANVADVVAATASSGNPRTFTVTTTATGSSANPAISAESGDTFVITAAGSNGTDEQGAEDGDTITIDGQTFSIAIGSGLGTGSDTQFHNALSKSIKDNTDFDTITIDSESGGYYKFHLTSSVAGTAKNVNFTQNSNGSRATFRNLDGAAGGTDTFGLQNLDSIVFSGSSDGASAGSVADSNTITFRINTAHAGNIQIGGPVSSETHAIGISDLLTTSDGGADDNTRSMTAWNRISASIKQQTNFDTINIDTFFDDSDGEHHAIFSITSSETGSAYNTEIIQTVTSSDDGKDGFTIVAQTAGGSDQSGSFADDTLNITNSAGANVTFTLKNDASATGLNINCGVDGTTPDDTAYFDRVQAAIIANTDYDLVTYTVASNTGSFKLTASKGTSDPFMANCASQGHMANCHLHLTGVAYNGGMVTGQSPNNVSFHDTAGPSGGVDGIFSDVKFLEIIPQPRYNYPHAIVSPGSLRCPTDKSNLGLIHQVQQQSDRYRLRSNHFALTRSLGKIGGVSTDGLYDNTSRWTTPDLSGLVPFDSDYDHYYERFRGHNKHHALVPEFRISSHIEELLITGNNEVDYFKKNYWLELTGTSLDDGASKSTNKRVHNNLREFNNEFTTTSKIKNMSKFIADNVDDLDMTPVTLTLTCEAIKHFLPYEGFYPQTRTVQMSKAFADSYARNINAVEADPNDTALDFPDNNPLAQARPVFDAITSPGLLYNTIKSGIAVDYPIISSKMATASVKDPYGGTNHMIANEYFEDRLPFETLLNPVKYMENKYIVDLHPHPSSSMNLKAKIGQKLNSNYELMSHNFFAESIEFFLDGRQTSRIISKPDTDPTFGMVPPGNIKDGKLPIYRGIFKVYKSKKEHPYIEFSGSDDIILAAQNPSGVADLYYNRPPSGTNYFLSEYGGLTGSDLEYDIEEVNYPRPNMNPFAEVGTITMYSQPNAFGPPCAGGVAVQFSSIDGEGVVQTGDDNNTSYMMYDSTNGYNAPYTPPYYDGEAWAIYTFTPDRPGKHSLNEILEKTTVEFLRYEVNHESGAFGDRGTFGPQGFTLNDNAMHVDASFNLFKKGVLLPQLSSPSAQAEAGFSPGSPGGAQQFSRGSVWIIESKYETPILDFSKYLNREYNTVFESNVTTDDVYTGSLSLSGSRAEPDTLSVINSSLGSVHELSGILNPIGMWHQYGDFPAQNDKGIFMQMTDIPNDYILYGTEMTIPNPKYTTIEPDSPACDGAGLSVAYGTANILNTVRPYVSRQLNKRKLVGDGQFSVLGGSIQVLDAKTEIILDAELKRSEVEAIFNIDNMDIRVDTGANMDKVADSFRFFNVFRDSTNYKKSQLTSGVFTSAAQKLSVSVGNALTTDYDNGGGGTFNGHWAANYYHYDQPATYAPLLIMTKNLKSLAYDYGEYSKGFFEDLLKDFSIGIKYSEQSTNFTDAEPVECVPSSITNRDVSVFAPAYVARFIDLQNDSLTAGSLSEIRIPQGGISNILNTTTNTAVVASTMVVASPEAKLVNASISTAKANRKTFNTFNTSTRKFRLIPPTPAAQNNADTSTYSYPEPSFVRGNIRYNAGYTTLAANLQTHLATHFPRSPQSAPQNENNITRGASTVRWGQFMHENGALPLTRSLADLVGFSTEPVKMGVTAKSQIISEAVIAIPYVVSLAAEPEYITLDYFSINKYLFQQGIIPQDRTETDSSDTIELDDALVRQIEHMRKYVIPPHLDFINYDVNPVPMYIFEFTEHLERDELNQIWQGVLPETLKTVRFDTKSVSHVLSAESLLGKLKNESSNMIGLKDIKWRVFKVKQKAKNNYHKKMFSDLFHMGVRTDANPGVDQGLMEFGENSATDDILGYNWPYDFCSIVEGAQISVDVEFIKVDPFNPVAPGGDPGTGTSDDTDTPTGYTLLDEPVVMLDEDYQDSLEAELQEIPVRVDEGASSELRQDSLADIVFGRETESSCVLAGTMIETERGTVPVEEINFDDKIKSYDFDRDGGAVFDYYDVMSIMRPVTKSKWAHVITSLGYELKCTEDHPLFTLSRGSNELPINQCEVGTKVWVVQDDEMVRDTIQSIEYFEEDVVVYNFEVRDVHSYLSNGILSHNKTVGTTGGTPSDGGPGAPPRTMPDSAPGTTEVRTTTTTTTSSGGSGGSGGSSY